LYSTCPSQKTRLAPDECRRLGRPTCRWSESDGGASTGAMMLAGVPRVSRGPAPVSPGGAVSPKAIVSAGALTAVSGTGPHRPLPSEEYAAKPRCSRGWHGAQPKALYPYAAWKV
jgi:hypothetical protein